MGVAGNTTDLKLADTAGKRMKAGGRLAAWNERRAVLQGQVDALTNELAQLDAASIAKLSELSTARVLDSGRLHIQERGAAWYLSTAETLALRDHLCNVLGLPDRFQDVATLTPTEAQRLSASLATQTCETFSRSAPGMLETLVRSAVISALDHVGVIQLNPPAPRSPGTPASQQGESVATQIAKPQASSPAAGTAGSAQNPNAASEDWDALHGKSRDFLSAAQAIRVSSLGPNAELVHATNAMLSIVDQFTALFYRLTNHDAAPKPSSPSIDLKA